MASEAVFRSASRSQPWKRGRSLVAAPAPTVERRTTASAWLHVARWSTAAVAVLAGWLVAFALPLSGVQEERSQRTLFAQFREQLASATAPTGGHTTPGTPVALLSSPALGLRDVVVVEGTASGDLRTGPGHRRDTVLPGQPGVSILFGKAMTFGGPFERAPRMKPGDKISVLTAQGRFSYDVVRLRRAGDPVTAPAAGTSRLTLVTAEADGWRSGVAPSRTLFVDAELKGKPLAAPAGRPTSVPVAETTMQGDPSAMVSLVLWLEALLAVALGLVWAARRWGAAQTQVVGGICLLAVVWNVSEAASRLLPNLV
jgi:sortase A